MPQKHHNTKKLENIRRSLRKNQTKPEMLLWSKIRNRKIGYKFRRQFGIGQYIVDFYCPEVKLIVELDGPIHLLPKNIIRDKKREDYLINEGYNIIRFSAYKTLNNLETVIAEIEIACSELSTSPNPPSSEEGNKKYDKY
ncbi:MAG: endonuclease domain-containing protein [Candidatus Magasanikiibacteriota bacterium]